VLDARKEEEIISFLGDADKRAALEVCIFNIGANVNFPILDTIERVFRKVWELACCSGFLAGREAAKLVRAARATSSSPARPRPCAAPSAMRLSPARNTRRRGNGHRVSCVI
jgi:hypothetical protein